MQKVLYIYGGGEAFHPSEWAGQVLAEMLAADGRFCLEATRDLDALAKLPSGEYAVVVFYTTGFNDELTGARAKGLFDFVRNGGGMVGIHSAADSFHGNREFIAMLGGEFLTHPPTHEYKVTIVDKSHYLTTRMPDFSIVDEMYHLQSYDPSRVTLLASTIWQGQVMPMAYTRAEGKGRVSYLALGHTHEAWGHPEFRKLLLRAIAWGAGADLPAKTLRCGLLGYGPAFNMGKGHAGWIDATPGMQTVAMCDANPARVEAAKSELPDLLGYFTSLDEMLAMRELDLVVNILPHNLHAPTTMQCLQAGKHVVQEKPFCITVAEANAMIDLARAKGLMLSLFHNRRWDGDYLTIQDLIRRGLIGDVFHIECGQAGYNPPGFWWRSDKAISGGIMYDWGAHFLDWILNLLPGAKITQVMGNFQKRVWHAVTNEDFGQAYIRFDNGATADYITSTISASGRPKWRINGTKGAIEHNWGDTLTLVTYANGIRQDSTVKITLPGYGSVEYYRNVADHLLLGEELIVKPEQARRVIGVIEAAQQSAQLGTSVPPCAGCE
jgi:predicted dehydrogenase/type 1 glutamine amidotransferase